MPTRATGSTSGGRSASMLSGTGLTMAQLPQEKDFVRLRRDTAPLCLEREQYLRHLLNQGTNPLYVRAVSSRLVHINRLLNLSAPRPVTTAEVQRATQDWLHYVAAHQSRGVRPSTAYTFQNATENWLRFHKLLVHSDQQVSPFDSELEGFLQFVLARQPSPDFLRSQRARLRVFLAWAGGAIWPDLGHHFERCRAIS